MHKIVRQAGKEPPMPKNFYAAVDMRRQEILRYLANHQNCALGEIAEEFKTSEMTVRRDLHALSAESLITQNSKGLYSLNCDPSFDPRYFLRYSAHHLWKAAIARAAVSLISPGDFIFMDSGTTVLELSKHLEGIEPLSVATNNLYIPMYLSQRPSRIQVEFLGGDVHLPSMSTYGLHACRKIESYNADLLFFSADGLDFEAGVSYICKLAYASEVTVLRDSPAESHELPSLELSWAWEPTGRGRA